MTYILKHFCESCNELFLGNEDSYGWCLKCKDHHILCDACWFVHAFGQWSAEEQEKYIWTLEN